MAFVIVTNPVECTVCKNITHMLVRSQEEINSFICKECIDKPIINSIIEEENKPALLSEEKGDSIE